MIGELWGTGMGKENGGRENVSALSRHLFGVHSLRLTMVVDGDGSDSRDQRPFRDGTAAHPGYVHSVRAQALSRDGAASYGLAIYNV